jgi:hypothetical protein
MMFLTVMECNMAKSAFNKKKTFFQTGLGVKEETSDMLLKSIDLYGAEIWTLRNYTSEIPRKF